MYLSGDLGKAGDLKKVERQVGKGATGCCTLSSSTTSVARLFLI